MKELEHMPGSEADHAGWILRALERRSPKLIAQMRAGSSLGPSLELTEIDLRNLAISIRDYVKSQNPAAEIASKDVVNASNIRALIKFVLGKISGATVTDAQAEKAFDDAKAVHLSMLAKKEG
jgi:hypothetical protein